MADFYENENGVHYIGPWSDYMLCGDAVDGLLSNWQHGISEEDTPLAMNDFRAMEPSKKRVVTCPKCIIMIKHCRGVRFREEVTDNAPTG